MRHVLGGLAALLFFSGPTAAQPAQRGPESLPSGQNWCAMVNEAAYARNFQRNRLSNLEAFPQVVTVFDLPMAADRRIGVEIATGEYVEIFKVMDVSSRVVVQVRLDQQDHWLMSRQSFLLRDDPRLRSTNPEASAWAFQMFQRELQNEIDETRWELRHFAITPPALPRC